jgi:proteasome lid subunit RPN8/RPN11
MQGKVQVHKPQLNYFRRRARNSKKEVLAFLLGTVTSPTLTKIEKFYYPELLVQTGAAVQAYTDGARATAAKLNLKIVGSIHSHSDWVPILSPTDYKAHITDGDRVSGIVGTNGRHTRVYFWTVDSALPLEIEYV